MTDLDPKREVVYLDRRHDLTTPAEAVWAVITERDDQGRLVAERWCLMDDEHRRLHG